MGADTVIMEWKALKEQLDNANVRDQENCWLILKEHEDYMINKGYEITFNQIISPEGVTLWERQSS